MTKKDIQFIKEVQHKAYELLRDLTNYNETDRGYGLTLDHNEKPDTASIASTGFMLSGYIIAVEYGYLSRENAIKIVKGTLHTLLYNIPHYHGFFPHFLNINSGDRKSKSEYSTIDTALCLNGVIAVDSYFEDAEISTLSNQLLSRVDWNHFVHIHEGKKRFYMAYNPDKHGDYVTGKPGFIFQWHMLAEQLMMYVMAAGGGSVDADLANELYEGFERIQGSYGGHKYFYSPGNTLFVYQYPLCWFDLKGIYDKAGISWFENTREATLGHRAWNLRNYHKIKTFAKETFGFTASSTPKGYGVFHCIPNAHNKIITDGTMAPNAMIGSLIFTPKESLKAMYYMKSLPQVWGKYGFVDAYNFEEEKPLYSNRYITIDKGLELLMCNAYLSKDVQNAYMNHPIIKKGMEILEWTQR